MTIKRRSAGLLLLLWLTGVSSASLLRAQQAPFDDRIREIFERGWALESRMHIDLTVTELNRCLDIRNPTYVWDAELYDRPEAKKLLARIEPSH